MDNEKSKKVTGKGKIKKVDIEFDFDGFDDVGFSNKTNTKNDTDKSKTNEI